jgi:hypothetical protein
MTWTAFPSNEINGSEANRMAKKRKPNQEMQRWIDARKRYHLSHAQVQMARELGMNPMKLGKLDNHEQELWKMPLRAYIEHLYLKRCGKPSPDNITSVEERLRLEQEKKEGGVPPSDNSPQRLHETLRVRQGNPHARRGAFRVHEC